ncbi:hypothetical protein C8Q74DRAFT_1341823 [Fomes fomentarius]|nr:hypothetical protein C8Q74DRAFT_1341823 [Fomes fomentarius]
MIDNFNEVQKLFLEAYDMHDFSKIMRIEFLRRPRSLPGHVVLSPLVLENTWNVPFICNSHDFLAANLQKMYAASLAGGHANGRTHLNCTSIIQSSGSGKSRLVDEVAKHIFTIPFNIREEDDMNDGAWPPPDQSIRDWFLELSKNVHEELQLSRRYLCFFHAVFEETTKAIHALQPHDTQEGSFALWWHNHLVADVRDQLYARVVEQAHALVEELTSLERKVNLARDCTHVNAALQDLQHREQTIENNTRKALGTLASLVCKRSNHSTSDHSITRPGLAPASTIHVFMYFDEAHALARWRAELGKSLLDVLVQTLDRFECLGAFTVSVSTQSQLEYLAPSSLFAPSARVRQLVEHMHDPITATPFNCIPDELEPSDFKADDVSEVGFMAQFGRPLWTSMLSHCAGNSSMSEDGTIDGKTLLRFAHSKLLCQTLVTKERLFYSEIAQAAVLDVRIMLAYNPSVSAIHAHKHQMDLVASHMRTVYAIPHSRDYVYAGYSSEPILAEAAARQLHEWRKLEMRDRDSAQVVLEPAVAILRDNLKHDLLARGEIGKAVGRLLLTLAHDRAVEDTLKNTVLYFSSPIPVVAFFKALFPDEIAERVLDSVPDNEVNGKTLRDAFKNAVLNFTHFAKWADNPSLLEASAAGCFMRHMAVTSRNSGPFVDVFLPILLDREAPLGPENMSGIFVQFKLREKPGSLSAYTIAEERIKFFSPDEETDENGLRPYITLIMELGVESKTSTRDSTAHATPWKIHISDAPARSSQRIRKGAHPHYSMYVYGCSPSVYKVIREGERDIYEQIIRSGDVLVEHPRLDGEALGLVRNQKPFFAQGPASWHWFKNKDINPDKLTAVANGRG